MGVWVETCERLLTVNEFVRMGSSHAYKEGANYPKSLVRFPLIGAILPFE